MSIVVEVNREFVPGELGFLVEYSDEDWNITYLLGTPVKDINTKKPRVLGFCGIDQESEFRVVAKGMGRVLRMDKTRSSGGLTAEVEVIDTLKELRDALCEYHNL